MPYATECPAYVALMDHLMADVDRLIRLADAALASPYPLAPLDRALVEVHVGSLTAIQARLVEVIDGG